MKQEIINKILKHAKEKETITLKSTSEAVEISLHTAQQYLVGMAIDGYLDYLPQNKKLEKGEKPSGYTYKSWRLKK